METEQKTTDYQSVLADLETQRDELDKAIAVIKRVLGMSPSVTGGDMPAKHHGGHTLTPTAFFGMSVGDAAKKYLAIAKEPKSAPVIAKALQDHGIKTVSKNFTQTVFSALERKEDTGEIVRPKRGIWGLAEWYPGFRPKKENGDKKNEPEQKSSTNRRAAGHSGEITINAFEDFVREKPRRMKEVLTHFGTDKSTVQKLLEPASKVHLAGIGWLKVRQ